MKSNRRDFLQKAGLMALVAGISLSGPSVVSASEINEEYSEITVVASANDAVTDTIRGKCGATSAIMFLHSRASLMGLIPVVRTDLCRLKNQPHGMM